LPPVTPAAEPTSASSSPRPRTRNPPFEAPPTAHPPHRSAAGPGPRSVLEVRAVLHPLTAMPRRRKSPTETLPRVPPGVLLLRLRVFRWRDARRIAVGDVTARAQVRRLELLLGRGRSTRRSPRLPPPATPAINTRGRLLGVTLVLRTVLSPYLTALLLVLLRALLTLS
jgi:hypothetical protein